MGKLPKISDAEWEVMKIIWALGEATSSEIIEELKGKQPWKSTTVKSLISFKKLGKEYFYFPLVSEEECIKEESNSFIKKVFNGSLNEMILNFVKSYNLTKEDINDLRSLLDEKFISGEK